VRAVKFAHIAREVFGVATYRSLPARASFAQFQLDLATGELLSSNGASVRIQQQPLQVLRLLLEANGRVVSREELRTTLWPEDTFVDFEHSVNTAVKKLRRGWKTQLKARSSSRRCRRWVTASWFPLTGWRKKALTIHEAMMH
jgi:DNA-binding response OmpR family regulator